MLKIRDNIILNATEAPMIDNIPDQTIEIIGSNGSIVLIFVKKLNGCINLAEPATKTCFIALELIF